MLIQYTYINDSSVNNTQRGSDLMSEVKDAAPVQEAFVSGLSLQSGPERRCDLHCYQS